MSDPASFIDWYLSLEEKDASSNRKLLRIFERKNGEYYTAHGKAAEQIAEEQFKTRTVLRTLGSHKSKTLLGVTLRPALFKKLLYNLIIISYHYTLSEDSYHYILYLILSSYLIFISYHYILYLVYVGVTLRPGLFKKLLYILSLDLIFIPYLHILSFYLISHLIFIPYLHILSFYLISHLIFIPYLHILSLYLISCVTLRPGLFKKLLRSQLLIKKGDVELYEQKGDKWVVKKSGTPGNVGAFEEYLSGDAGDEEGDISSAMLAVRFTLSSSGSRLFGVAFADTTSRTLTIAEFEDNERLSNFESVLLSHGARECLLGVDKGKVAPPEVTKLQGMLERCEVPMQEKKAAEFNSKDITQDLGRLVKGGVQQHLSKMEKARAMAALSCLISSLQLLSDESGFGRWTLEQLDLSEYMKLDQAAVKALNLFPAPGDADKTMSLYGLLNKTKTNMGARLLSQWIKQPLLDIAKLRQRQDFVEALVDDEELRQALQAHLRGTPDLDRLSKRFLAGKGSLQQMVGLYAWLLKLPALINALDAYTGAHKQALNETFLSPLQAMAKDLQQLEAMVESTIDLESLEHHQYFINPNFSPQLAHLKKDQDGLSKKLENILEQVAEDLNLDAKHIKLNHVANLGHHLRISRKNETMLRKKAKNYTTLETRKDGVRFTTIKMKAISRQLTQLEEEYNSTQQDIVDKCLQIVCSYTPVLESATRVLAFLDVLTALAHVSAHAPIPYTRPKLLPLGSDEYKLKQARHPCLEVQSQVQFIANDIDMVRGTSSTQVITGPNMGGKSTFIRMAGVISLMAQIGSFVPCQKAEIPVVDCVLARVGAGDSQLKGVSTFMKEMLEASSILKEATQNSLLIIDELGRGTSTYDGFGLAWAIAEYLTINVRAFTLFATHFHELTELAVGQTSVANKHVTALATENSITMLYQVRNSITMLYQVRDGPCDRSFGIHVAELAQFPPQVIEEARRKAEELEDFGKQVESSGLLGTKRNKSAAGATSPPSKRQKILTDEEEVKELSQSEQGFLKEFAALPLDGLDANKAREQVQAMAAKYKLSL
eukprot:g26766.t1